MVGGDPSRRRGLGDPSEAARPAAARRHQRPRRRASLIAALLATLTLAGEARADELEDFISARDAYINGEYARATRELEELVGRPSTPQLAVLRPAARKYLAASLFAERHEPEARAEIATLLREDPRARLDPASFEARFVRLYEDVVRSMEPELDRLLLDRAQARRLEENTRDARRALALELLGSEARVEVVPRWQTFVPFGVGQFANRQTGLGALFLSLEATFLLGSVATAIVDQSVQSTTTQAGVFVQDTDGDRRANIAFAMRVMNWTLLSAFVATTAIGIWQANDAYVPQRVINRVPRPLPPGLQGLQFSAHPGGFGASLLGTF